MRVLLAVGSALATAVIVHKRRAARRQQQQHGKPRAPALVHAYPSYAAQQQQQQQHTLATMKQLQQSPVPASSEASVPTSMRGAWSSLLLLLSIALALGSVALLVARGQADAAAAVALTWLLAAPAILALGKQSAQQQQQQQRGMQQGLQEDAVMVVEDGASDCSGSSSQRLAQPTQELVEAFHGTWIKDNAASESMEAAMRLIRLNPVMRQAVKLIRGVQLRIEPDAFRFAVFSAISWFKITETFGWDGEVHENRRRDMRRGRSRGRVGASPQGTLVLRYEWDAPHAGTATDEFSIDEQGRLRLTTAVQVGDATAGYVQIYRRRARGSSSSGGGGSGGGASVQRH